MEIPVQIVQKEKQYYQEEYPQQQQQQQQQQELTIIKKKEQVVELPIYNKNYNTNLYQEQQQLEQDFYYNKKQYINETELYAQKKYRYTLAVDQIYQDNFQNYFQQQQQQQLENLFVAKYKPNLRVVVVKFRQYQQQQQQQKQVELKTKYFQRRIIVLPRHVQADTVKVVYVKEQRQILVKARFQPNIEQILQQERQHLLRYPLPVEYDLRSYRLLKNLVKKEIRYQQFYQDEQQYRNFVQQPFYVPRIAINQESNKQKLLLEVNTRYNRPLQVQLEATKRAVVIYRKDAYYQRQQEFYLPSNYFKLEKVTYVNRQQQPQYQQLTLVLPFRKYARQNFF